MVLLWARVRATGVYGRPAEAPGPGGCTLADYSADFGRVLWDGAPLAGGRSWAAANAGLRPGKPAVPLDAAPGAGRRRRAPRGGRGRRRGTRRGGGGVAAGGPAAGPGVPAVDVCGAGSAPWRRARTAAASSQRPPTGGFVRLPGRRRPLDAAHRGRARRQGVGARARPELTAAAGRL